MPLRSFISARDIGAISAIDIGAISAIDIGAISAVDVGVAVDVRVAVEVVEIVYLDVVVTAPSGVIAPASAPHRAHGNSNAERNRHARRVVPRRWINDRRIGINHRWRTIHHNGIVGGNIHNLRIGLLDYNHLLGLNYLGLNLRLLVGF